MEKIVFDKDIVNNQLTVLNNSLVQQRDSKKTLLSYLEKFSNAMYEDFNSKDTEILLSLLNEAHYVFECIKLNINKILELKNFLENISKTDFLDSINAEKFNQDFTLLFEDISKTNSSYLMFMNNYKKTINTFKEENVLDFETPLSSDTLETSNFEDSQEIEEKTEEIINNNNNNNIETFAENSIEEINSENNIESDTQTLVEKSTSKNEIENVVKKSTEEPSIIDYIEEDYNFIVPLKNKNIEKSNELISKIDTIIEEGEFKDNITQLVNNLAEEEVLKNNVLQVVDTLAEEESLKNNSEQFIESSNKELSSDNNIETNVEISNEELSSDNNIETNAEISNEELSSDNNIETTIEISNEELSSDNNIETNAEISNKELSSNNETNSKNESRNFELVEKTLLICKDEGIAVLPYSVTDLEEFFSNNPEKYSSIQDIIDQEYTISLKDFENTAFTRYKEAYKLAKNKSNLSLPQTVSYAKKMILISELSPIIIASCADVNELDYYLECLDNNNLDKFEAFKIIKK